MDVLVNPPTHITEFQLTNESFDQSKVNVTSINHIEGGMVLRGIISQDECKLIVDKMFEHPSSTAASLPTQPVLFRGWSDSPDDEYKKLGIRVIRTSEELASTLSQRIKQFVPQSLSTPSSKGDIKWSLNGLSHRHRFIRYDQGQNFPTHMDGPYTKSDSEKSHITILFFLNDDYKGGELSFVVEEGKEGSYQTSALDTIKPETGMVIIFPHKNLHTSSPIESGHKYLIRNDIMYNIIE